MTCQEALDKAAEMLSTAEDSIGENTYSHGKYLHGKYLELAQMYMNLSVQLE